MGLIVASNIAVHVATEVCTEGSCSSGYENVKSFDKTIYRILSMESDMKTLKVPTTLNSEWERFLDTAIKKASSQPYDINFDNMDTYLGTIGVTNGIC